MFKGLAAKAGVRAALGLISDDMAEVVDTIHAVLGTDIARVAEVADYITGKPGKMMRPALVLLGAGALGHKGSDATRLGAAIEILHTASLMHDDVVDEASMRRGRETANARWDNKTAVLVGDFLYTRAFQMAVESGNMKATSSIALTVNRLSEGEVLQMDNTHDPSVDRRRYYGVIERKTACLFKCAAMLAASVANPAKNEEDALIEYATKLGYAFQIADDVLDYAGDEASTGKALGADLREGKMTLPLICALERTAGEEKALIEEAVRQGDGNFGRIAAIVRSCGAVDATMAEARALVDDGKKCLERLPAGPYRSALASVIAYTVERSA